jgi:hypothetical protein
MPPIQDLEDSSEDEFSTIPEMDQVVSSPPMDSHSKSHDSFNSNPSLPTPAASTSPVLVALSPDKATSATLGRSPTPDFESSTQTSRKRKRRDSIQRDSIDSNAAQNRELIDGNLRQNTHPS